MNKITLIDSKNIYGTMNTGTVRFSNLTDTDKKMLMEIHQMSTLDELKSYTLTGDDKRRVFMEHRKNMARDYGFDWGHMFMADQKNLDGSVFEITRDYVNAYPNGWTDIPEDILMIRSDLDGVALGHPVADCPVVVAEDRKQGILAVAHCGGEMIDKKLPIMTIEALYRQASRPEDIFVYVGACAGNGWIYKNNMPAWAKDEQLWNGVIVPGVEVAPKGEINTYSIDLRKALAKEFDYVGLDQSNIIYDYHDTILDPNYYSNSQGRVDESKIGRQFVGAVYQKSNTGRSR